MVDDVISIIKSEFLWGTALGALLSMGGAYLQVRFQAASFTKQQTSEIKALCQDIIQNMKPISEEMTTSRRRSNAIHHEFIEQMNDEFTIYYRNIEKTIHLSKADRQMVREFIKKCAIVRSDIVNGLTKLREISDLKAEYERENREYDETSLNQDYSNYYIDVSKSVDEMVSICRSMTNLH